MKKRHLIFLAFISSYLLISPQVFAYKAGGIIYEINTRFINVNDLQFPLSPTVTVTRADKSPELLINLKPGDRVRIETILRNHRYYAKKIQLLE